MRLAVCVCLLIATGCAGVLRDSYPGTFRAALLNDTRQDLYDRSIPLWTPSSVTREVPARTPSRLLASMTPPRIRIPAARVPPLPETDPYRVMPARPRRIARTRPRVAVPGRVTTRRRARKVVRRRRAPRRVRVAQVPSLSTREGGQWGRATAALSRWFRHGEAPDLRRKRLAAFAASLVGSRRIVVNGRRFASNCSDFVRAVYSIEGVDLYKWPGRLHGGGVLSLYRMTKAAGGLHFWRRPLPGDLVFFHHTYDFNRNKRVDDFLSHVGIVERVDGDGTAHYLDFSSRRVRRGQINVMRPHLWRDPLTLKRLNSYLRRRRRTDPKGTRYLAGALFAGFGTLLR